MEPRDGGPDPAEALQAKWPKETIMRALEEIPLPRREVLVMYDLENVPMNEVATALSIPLFTGYSRLRTARTDLERALDGSRSSLPLKEPFRNVSLNARKLKHKVLKIPDEGPDPAEALQAKQAMATVIRALERIPPRRRVVLVMYDLESVPMNEVATALSIPLFTAYSRLRKARTELATAVRRMDEGLP